MTNIYLYHSLLIMKLSAWAKKQGIGYRAVWDMFRRGEIPLAYKLPTGTIIIPEEENVGKPDYTVCYARVSSSQNKKNLDSQMERLNAFRAASGYIVRESVKECASGLNDKRPELCRILSSGKATKIIVGHKDRLTRFGFDYLQILLTDQGCEIIVTNEAENSRDDLLQDLVSIITSFCAGIYGQRRCERKTETIIRALTFPRFNLTHCLY